MLRAVQVGTKADALVCDFAQISKAENLVAARVGENSAGPGHEGMQAAEFANQGMTGAKIKMIGVGQDDFCAESLESFLGKPFYSCSRADGHEYGRLDDAVRRGEKASPRAGGVNMIKFEGKTHFSSVSGEDKGDSHTQHNIDQEDREHDRE